MSKNYLDEELVEVELRDWFTYKYDSDMPVLEIIHAIENILRNMKPINEQVLLKNQCPNFSNGYTNTFCEWLEDQAGLAPCLFQIRNRITDELICDIKFQNGEYKKGVLVNGITDVDLLFIILERLNHIKNTNAYVLDDDYETAMEYITRASEILMRKSEIKITKNKIKKDNNIRRFIKWIRKLLNCSC